MKRAIVLIGVQEAKGLPELEAVWDGVAEMKRWAVDQGFDAIETFTDEDGPVRIPAIRSRIRELIDAAVYEQLVVYFAGHGINNGQSEYWLLSEVKSFPDEAVNLKASEDLARYNGISHVVFISDACRTAAKGISQQRIDGSMIFPNGNTDGVARYVDIFYATTLGGAALEIEDVGESAKTYRAIYTEALVEALDGRQPKARKHDADDKHYVRMWDLRDFLAEEVPLRVYQSVKKTQTPDAIISSRDMWISVFSDPPPPVPVGGLLGFGGDGGTPPPSPAALSTRMLREAAADDPGVLPAALQRLENEIDTTDRGQADLGRRIAAAAQPFGPLHFETGCGFKATGARIVKAVGRAGELEVIDITENGDESWVSLYLPDSRPANAVIAFDNGTCVVLPGLHEFIGALTFVGRDLVSVSYDPMDYSWRWAEYGDRLAEIWQLRSVVAAASAMSTFRLPDDEEGRRLARRMQFGKGYDPTLAVYAAYAYRDQQRRDRLNDMAGYQASDLGVTLFDIAMLSRRIDGQAPGAREQVLPFAPLLSQGWALLPAHGLELPDALAPIRDGVITDSLWTLYTEDCLDALHEAIERGDV
jgi:hypothetical protein